MMLSETFSYDPNFPADIRVAGQHATDGVVSKIFTFATENGWRRSAEVLRPETGEGPFPVILYVHWYETHQPEISNRYQFKAEARQMAAKGAVCLLVETMWSDLDYFLKRTQDDDLRMSQEQVRELRQAMDILLAEPGVDPSRFMYVGHDFGGMYGVLAGAVDQRPTHYVIMAATPRWPDWFLYYPPMEDEPKAAFIEAMQPYDPITVVPQLAPAPVLFQLGDDDLHVPEDRGKEFFAAAGDPKDIKWYQAGHGLNETATTDRIDWVTTQLGL